MTVGEAIELFSAEDPDLILVFTLDGQIFVSPCPVECGVMEFGEATPHVDPDGELVVEQLPNQMPRRMYALFPHDPNNPHDEPDNNQTEE